MNHLIKTYIAGFFIALVAIGCSDESVLQDDVLSEGFNITIDIPVRGARSLSDDLNEFKVNSLRLYFFSAEGYSTRTSEYKFIYDVDVRFDYSHTFRIEFPRNALETGGIFGPDGTECIVYAVANVDPTLLEGIHTVDEIRNVTVGSGFDNTVIQPAFAMDGEARIILDRDTRLAAGNVTLQRAAAKLTLAIDVPDSIDVVHTIIDPFGGPGRQDTVKYYSMPKEMWLWIANGAAISPLNTSPVPVDEDRLYSNEIRIADGNGSPFVADMSRPRHKYLQKVPFYSYPTKWDPYSPRGNCFITLVAPWYYVDNLGNRKVTVTYYKINVQPSDTEIVRNTHYDMRITLSRLGGTSVSEPVNMTFDWHYAMEWNIYTLPTDIKEIRYLLMNNNNFSSSLNAYTFKMDNERQISIPYSTSHPVEIEELTLSWRDYKNNRDRNIVLTKNSGNYPYTDIDNYSPATIFAGVDIDQSKGEITLLRDLRHIAWQNNKAVITSDNAINAYTFRIKIRHTDADPLDPASHATIIVTQIPAIYITTRLTASGTRFVNKNNYNYSTRNRRGYLSTSSTAPSNTTQRHYWLGSIHDDSYVENKHTYLLTISKFAETDNYVIADPRKRSVDNLAVSGTDWSMEDNKNKRLSNYYPADNSASKSRFIAPQLLVASQWGVTYQIFRDGAERRCASYQEDGRPAGRWRLPTAAEIEYISNLSNKQYIPYLFGTAGNTASYWCASGGINVVNDPDNPYVEVVTTGSTEQRAVRCVYDEWYWGSDTLTNKKTYTYGDRLRSKSSK